MSPHQHCVNVVIHEQYAEKRFLLLATVTEVEMLLFSNFTCSCCTMWLLWRNSI